MKMFFLVIILCIIGTAVSSNGSTGVPHRDGILKWGIKFG